MKPALPRYKKGFLRRNGSCEIPYVSIGDGEIPIVVLPGAGDGRSLVTEAAFQLALFYRKRSNRYRTIVISRRHPYPADFSMGEQARDALWAAEELQIGPFFLECNSAGGPAGQLAALQRPDLVKGLILSVTLHRSNPKTDAVLRLWLDQIRDRRWEEFTWSSIEFTMRPKTVRQYRMLRPFLRFVAPAPKYPERLESMLSALLDFDHSSLLPGIQVPTLVIGGEEDRVIPADIQREMASLIPRAECKLYPEYGHSNDQENPEYSKEVDRFIERVTG